MLRREALLVLGSGGVGAALGAGTVAQANADMELDAHVGEVLLRHIAAVEPLPGEGARVADALNGLVRPPDTDPRVQPILGFNPEV